MQTAIAVGRRSLCSRDQVGAVIVTAENRIIDTGYNGPPAGWQPIHTDSCIIWCPRSAAAHWCETSEGEDCPDIATEVNRNGLSKDYSDCPALHAEANALMFGDRAQRVGGTIYVSSTVCMGCAKLIANSGLRRVVFQRPTIDDKHRTPQLSIDFMAECGLEVTEYESPGR